VVEFTPAMLAEVASTYNPKLHEAPIVIGHPKVDDLAYGWIDQVAFADGALVATEKQVDPDFNELRRAGRLKKPSASFYTPDAPNNPTPGKWHLRHVGFLGAVPPALKGLNAARQVSFAESEEGVLTFADLPGYAGLDIARMFRRLREWFIAEKGQDVADQVLPAWEVDGVQTTAQRAADAPDDEDANQLPGGTPALAFAEPGQAATLSTQENPPMTKTVEQLQAELDASKAETAALRASEAKRAADARHAEHVSFADTLVADAKWPKDASGVLVAVLDVLAKPEGVVSFGEGDAAKPLPKALQEQLSALPPSVSFSEFAKNGAAKAALSDQEVAGRARAYQERMQGKGQTVSLSQAIDAVNAGTDQA